MSQVPGPSTLSPSNVSGRCAAVPAGYTVSACPISNTRPCRVPRFAGEQIVAPLFLRVPLSVESKLPEPLLEPRLHRIDAGFVVRAGIDPGEKPKILEIAVEIAFEIFDDWIGHVPFRSPARELGDRFVAHLAGEHVRRSPDRESRRPRRSRPARGSAAA